MIKAVRSVRFAHAVLPCLITALAFGGCSPPESAGDGLDPSMVDPRFAKFVGIWQSKGASETVECGAGRNVFGLSWTIRVRVSDDKLMFDSQECTLALDVATDAATVKRPQTCRVTTYGMMVTRTTVDLRFAVDGEEATLVWTSKAELIVNKQPSACTYAVVGGLVRAKR